MRPFRNIIVVALAATLFTACEKKSSKSKAPEQPAPPAPTAPGPSDRKDSESAPQDKTAETSPATTPGSQTTTRTAENPTGTNQRVGELQRSLPPHSDLPRPSESSASIPPAPQAPRVEGALPTPTPLETFGGQLVTAYLRGEITGDQTIAQVFDNSDLIVSNLAEMSAAIRTLRSQNRYSTASQEKVLVLEGAMTQYLNEKLERDQNMAAALEYGTAAALGLVGGYYSNEIIGALQRLGTSSVVQGPMRAVHSVYESAKGSPAAISAWLRSRWPLNRASKAADDAVEETVSRSTDLYRRTVGYMKAPKDQEARNLTVFNNIYRVINSPQLAKGYKVTQVSPSHLDEVQHLNFHRTGIPGFRVNQEPGADFLTAQMVVRGGEVEYYKITGLGIKSVTKNGEEMVIPPQVMSGLIYSRLRHWGERTAEIVKSTGQRSRDAVTNSRPYQYVSTDPFARRIAQGAAVGVPISALTLLALRPIDTTYLTLDEYVRDLEADGIHLEKHLDAERTKTAAGRM